MKHFLVAFGRHVAAHWRMLVVSIAVPAVVITAGAAFWVVAEPRPATQVAQEAPLPRTSGAPSTAATDAPEGEPEPEPEPEAEAETAAPPEAVAPATPAAPAAPAPPPAPAPAPPPAPTAVSVPEVLQLVNAERANAGLAPLAESASLNSTAGAHASWMAATGSFQHSTYPGGWSSWGENIARGYSSAASVVAGWMGSPGHRANILNPAYTHMGTGYVAAGNYWCQQFGA